MTIATGQLSSRAEQCLREGLARQRAGCTEEALRLFESALHEAPGHPDALYFRAMLYIETGRTDQGIAELEEALRARPDFLAAQVNLGMAWRAAGHYEEAAAAFRKAVAIDPTRAETHAALADSLADCGQPLQAIENYRRAIALSPDDAGLVVRLGVALQQAGAIDDAIHCFERALALDPDDADAHNDLGVALSLLNRTEAAADSFRRAIAASPAHVSAHVNLGLALLRLGEWQKGWAEFEWRLRVPDPNPVQQWDGSPMHGGSLLVQAEQGFGDSLQFCRYVPAVAMRSGARVILEVPAPLVRLLSRLPGAAVVVETGQASERADRRCALASMPLIFATTPQTIPGRVPYLRADADAVAAWRGRLADRGGMTVGLVWGGNPNFGVSARDLVDTRRSVPLSALAPLAEVEGITLVSLQKGPASAQLHYAPPGLRLFDPTAELTDFADTAALVTALDLVISVDTSVAHLTGALGCLGWVLARFDADWRWPWNGDSPWYPTLRQFRQRTRGDWAPVIAAVRDALAQASKSWR